jgi:hypothetical protein
MRAAGNALHGGRLRGVIVVLWWRAVHPRSARPTESDLDPARGSLLLRRGKGGRCRDVGYVEMRRKPSAGRRHCQLGHNLGITSIDLQRIDNANILDTVASGAPTSPASTPAGSSHPRRRKSRNARATVRAPSCRHPRASTSCLCNQALRRAA